MTEEEQLRKEISELENQIKPKQERLNIILRQKEADIEDRLKKARQGKGNFTLDELLFSANNRCHCGAGFAYPKGISMHGSWYCSSILIGTAEAGSEHDSPMPFSFYEVKSEGQPSANGATTRPMDGEGESKEG